MKNKHKFNNISNYPSFSLRVIVNLTLIFLLLLLNSFCSQGKKKAEFYKDPKFLLLYNSTTNLPSVLTMPVPNCGDWGFGDFLEDGNPLLSIKYNKQILQNLFYIKPHLIGCQPKGFTLTSDGSTNIESREFQYSPLSSRPQFPTIIKLSQSFPVSTLQYGLTYNANGFITYYKVSCANNSAGSTERNITYDDKMRISKIEETTPKDCSITGSPAQTIKDITTYSFPTDDFEPDSSSRVVNDSSTTTTKTIYTYQRENGKIIKRVELIYVTNGSTITGSSIIYNLLYDWGGRLSVKEKKAVASSSTIYTNYYTYGNNGKLIQDSARNTISSTVETWDYTYDRNNRNVSWICTTLSGGLPSSCSSGLSGSLSYSNNKPVNIYENGLSVMKTCNFVY